MKHQIEVFSAGCDLCQQTIELVGTRAGSESDVIVHDMRQEANVQRAQRYGVRSVPAVVIDGSLLVAAPGGARTSGFSARRSSEADCCHIRARTRKCSHFGLHQTTLI
jgi:hypothetical protein